MSGKNVMLSDACSFPPLDDEIQIDPWFQQMRLRILNNEGQIK